MGVLFKRLLLLFLIPVVLALGIPSICDANTPPPPSIFIIVTNAPKDLTLSIGASNFTRRDKLFEGYFGLFLFTHNPVVTDKLKVISGNSTYEIAIPPLTSYTTTFTLDLKNMTLTEGTSAFRPYEFASITILLTLLIEGVIFYLWGFRKKKSWIAFVLINLVTQGFLYVWLDTMLYPSFTQYFGIQLIFGEFWVFIIELIAFSIFVTERKRSLTSLYVVTANFLSLIAGGFLVNLTI